MAEDAIGRASVDGTEVVGVDVDLETRCVHYGTDRDVLAVALACCGTFYACYRSNGATADHDAEVWPVSARDERALPCGACDSRFSIETKPDAPLACPECGAAFDPGCRDHHDRYFRV